MNLRELLTLKGIEWHQGATDDEISICCPFCVERNETPDTKFRLGINIRKNVAHDFNCDWGARKNAIQLILDKLSIEDEVSDKDDEPIKEEKRKFDGKLPESFELLWPLKKDKDFLKAYNYLKNRGVSDSQIKEYKIGFCLAGKYSYRIIFPIYIKDKLRCFIGRDYTGKQNLRYKNSIGDKTLFGIPKNPIRKALLVEGVFDKLAAERVFGNQIDVLGIPGRTLKDSDLKYLENYREIIRVPDDDKPGLKGAVKDISKLNANGFKKVYISFLSTNYKDISDAYKHKDYYAIERLALDARKELTYSMEVKIRTMLATEYRGAMHV